MKHLDHLISNACLSMAAAAAGMKMTHVPYKGATQALTDLVGGQVQVLAPSLTGSTPKSSKPPRCPKCASNCSQPVTSSTAARRNNSLRRSPMALPRWARSFAKQTSRSNSPKSRSRSGSCYAACGGLAQQRGQLFPTTYCGERNSSGDTTARQLKHSA